ncbi:MAG: SPOR domain-containing protein [Bacteroidota bacterium]|nr:SPOR domain-containing protein [Bacteroidota bacterium]
MDSSLAKRPHPNPLSPQGEELVRGSLKHKTYLLIFCVASGLMLWGCSSSETEKETAAPSPADSAAIAPRQALSQPAGEQSSAAQPKPEKKPARQGFVAREDTIEAQLVKKNKWNPAAEPRAPRNRLKAMERKKYYSVQVGAFRIIANAERCQKLVKKRFRKPVHQFYDRGIKMYRITVGNFSTKKTAFVFLRRVKNDFAKDYSDAWVAELR